MRIFFRHWLKPLIALLAGALLTLGFAPFSVFPVAIISPAVLLALWLSASSPKQSFWLGWLFGLGFFGTGVYWVFISINTYGNTTFFVSILITCLMIAVLALFPAFLGMVFTRFFPKNNTSKILFAFPALWVLFEWIRSWIFSGFPWLFIGYSQMHSPLRGFAPFLSVYGVSLITVFCSALLFLLIKKIFEKNYRTAIFCALTFLILWITGALFSLISWTKPSGFPIQVSLVQGNIPQQVKWSPDQVQPTVDRYVELTDPHWNSQIIIWPESAIPVPLSSAAEFMQKMAEMAGQHNATFITGIPVKAPNDQGYYNGIIAVGKGSGMYIKHRLVPFGEYIPFRKVCGRVMDLLHVPMSDFIPGDAKPHPIMANDKKIAAFICYEIAYPEQVRMRDGNIDIILTVSNDAWFGHSIAQAQHVEMAEMRALEMGRPVLFASNDGITAVIDARGKIQSDAPQHEAYVLTDDVQTTEGKTPWQRWGMVPIALLFFIFLLIALRDRKNP